MLVYLYLGLLSVTPFGKLRFSNSLVSFAREVFLTLFEADTSS